MGKERSNQGGAAQKRERKEERGGVRKEEKGGDRDRRLEEDVGRKRRSPTASWQKPEKEEDAKNAGKAAPPLPVSTGLGQC